MMLINMHQALFKQDEREFQVILFENGAIYWKGLEKVHGNNVSRPLTHPGRVICAGFMTLS